MNNKKIGLVLLLLSGSITHWSYTAQAPENQKKVQEKNGKRSFYWKYGPTAAFLAVAGYCGYRGYSSPSFEKADEDRVQQFKNHLPGQPHDKDQKQNEGKESKTQSGALSTLAHTFASPGSLQKGPSAQSFQHFDPKPSAPDEDDGLGTSLNSSREHQEPSSPSLLRPSANQVKTEDPEKKGYASHIVYHPDYDISFFGIERALHYFDTHKYSKVFNYLVNKRLVHQGNVTVPTVISDQELLKVHSERYLDSLKSSATIARIAEILPPGRFAHWLAEKIPNGLLQRKLLHPVKLATKGTVVAAQHAMQHGGLVVNLSGGYHHAKEENGEGFCFFADIPLAIKTLQESQPNAKVLVIDLDAHQGNGVSTILKKDKLVKIIDAYHVGIYPNDTNAINGSNFRAIHLNRHTKDEDYLSLVSHALSEEIDRFKPNLIIYNAGTDILAGDPLGDLTISKKGIIKRDALVINAARTKNIPVAMVLSGGYTKQSATVISESLESIFQTIR